RRHTRFDCDWSSDVCSSDLEPTGAGTDRVHAGDHAGEDGIETGSGLGAARRGDGSDYSEHRAVGVAGAADGPAAAGSFGSAGWEIGRASCRERVWWGVGEGA